LAVPSFTFSLAELTMSFTFTLAVCIFPCRWFLAEKLLGYVYFLL
jgi:hypothetical protein